MSSAAVGAAAAASGDMNTNPLNTARFSRKMPPSANPRMESRISRRSLSAVGRWSSDAEVLISGGFYPAGIEWSKLNNVPKHSHPVQLRSAGDRRGDPRGIDPVRSQAVGFHQAVPGQRSGLRQAIDEVADVARRLIDSLVTTAAPRDREEWAARAKARAAERYAR